MQQEALASAVIALEPERRAAVKPGRDGAYAHYQLGRAYDEMFTADGRVRSHYADLHRRVAELSPEELAEIGIDPAMIRLSVGIEDTEDVVNDLMAALEKA